MATLKCGLISPFGEARFAADLAYEAEHAGWDGYFLSKAIWHNLPIYLSIDDRQNGLRL